MPPPFANTDLFTRLPNEVLSCVLQQVDQAHLLTEAMLVSKAWRASLVQADFLWFETVINSLCFHPRALVSVGHHVRKLDMIFVDGLWFAKFFEHIAVFRHLIRLLISPGVGDLYPFFTSQGWPARDQLESLEFGAHEPGFSLDLVMRACPKLTNLIYQNYAGIGPIPEEGLPFRPGLTSLSVTRHCTDNISRKKIAAILKACPNLRKFEVYPCNNSSLDLLDNAHHLETLHWNSSKRCFPHRWAGATEDMITARKDIGPLRRFRIQSYSDPNLIRLLKKYGHGLEMLQAEIYESPHMSGGFSCFQYDRTLFKRLRILEINSAHHLSLDIVAVILGLCDTNLLERLTLGFAAGPLEGAVFDSLARFSHLHTLRLWNLPYVEGIGTYWKAMADLGDHAPLTVVELCKTPLTAAELVTLGSVTTIKDISLLSLPEHPAFTKAFHHFLLKKWQHNRFQSITMDQVGGVTRDTLIEYIGKIPSLRSLTICHYTMPFTGQDIRDFIRLYPTVRFMFTDPWDDLIQLGVSRYNSRMLYPPLKKSPDRI